MVLETPMQDEQTWADEIKLLESLVGTRADDPDFLSKAAELSARGKGEREKAAVAAGRKVAKTLRIEEVQKKAGKKKV